MGGLPRSGRTGIFKSFADIPVTTPGIPPEDAEVAVEVAGTAATAGATNGGTAAAGRTRAVPDVATGTPATGPPIAAAPMDTAAPEVEVAALTAAVATGTAPPEAGIATGPGARTDGGAVDVTGAYAAGIGIVVEGREDTTAAERGTWTGAGGCNMVL